MILRSRGSLCLGRRKTSTPGLAGRVWEKADREFVPPGVETEECERIRVVYWEIVKWDFQYWTWRQGGWSRADVLLSEWDRWGRGP